MQSDLQLDLVIWILTVIGLIVFRETTTVRRLDQRWFVCQPELLNYIDDDNQMLEREPLERVIAAGELMAYKHEGFGTVWILNVIETF